MCDIQYIRSFAAVYIFVCHLIQILSFVCAIEKKKHRNSIGIAFDSPFNRYSEWMNGTKQFIVARLNIEIREELLLCDECSPLTDRKKKQRVYRLQQFNSSKETQIYRYKQNGNKKFFRPGTINFSFINRAARTLYLFFGSNSNQCNLCMCASTLITSHINSLIYIVHWLSLCISTFCERERKKEAANFFFCVGYQHMNEWSRIQSSETFTNQDNYRFNWIEINSLWWHHQLIIRHPVKVKCTQLLLWIFVTIFVCIINKQTKNLASDSESIFRTKTHKQTYTHLHWTGTKLPSISKYAIATIMHTQKRILNLNCPIEFRFVVCCCLWYFFFLLFSFHGIQQIVLCDG